MSEKGLKRRDLKSRLDGIDRETLQKGLGKYGEAWQLAQRGMWLKGKEVLKDYPEIEGKPAQGGRGVRAGFSEIARITGRKRDTVKKWVDLVKHIGRSEAEFRRWTTLAVPKAVAKWQNSLPAETLKKLR